MTDEGRVWEVFLDVHRDMPRQGPGCDESTLRALQLCGELSDPARVLDVGCGPGMQTLVLARALPARVVAVDLFRQYLDQLRSSAAASGLDHRIDLVECDMRDLPFATATFDLVWAEGSAYVMGIDEALEAWQRVMAPRGYLAFTELVWTRDDPLRAVAEFFAAEYPAMRNVAGIAGAIDAANLELVGHFELPDAAWWQHYYGPLEERLPLLCEKYAADEEALGVISSAQHEIEMRRQFSQSYGYEFFVTRRR